MTSAKRRSLIVLTAILIGILFLCMLTASVGTMSATADSKTTVFENSNIDLKLTYSKTSGSGADEITVTKIALAAPLTATGTISFDEFYYEYQRTSQDGSDYELDAVDIRVNLAKPFQLWGENGYGLYYTLYAAETQAVILYLADESKGQGGPAGDIYDGTFGSGAVETFGGTYYFQPTNARVEGLKIAGISIHLDETINFQGGYLGVTGGPEPAGPSEPDPEDPDSDKDPADPGSDTGTETPGDQEPEEPEQTVTDALKNFAEENKVLLITIGIAAFMLIIVLIATRPRRRRR